MQLQVRPEGKQTAVAILHNKLARMPGCVCKSAREFHASSSILGVKRVYILDEYVGVEQFVRIFVGVGWRRFGKAEVNRTLVARNDGVNRRVMPRAQALETKLISVIGKSAGNVHGEELRRDLTDHWPSLLQQSARCRPRVTGCFLPHSRENGVPATREDSARDRRQSFDNSIKEGLPVTRDEKT